MRKYQQLCLVIISFLSVVILLSYKSENNRLKYVLQVVNFFGRKDVTLLQMENITKYSVYHYDSPSPIWQRIGNDFHAYSSFWHKNAYAAGGEVTTLVTGDDHSIINFRCQLVYSPQNIITGKFKFTRVVAAEESQSAPVAAVAPPPPSNTINKFSVYKFLCRINRDFGFPESVVYTDVKTSQNHSLQLRSTQNKQIKQKQTFVVCLDMNPYPNANEQLLDQHGHLLEYFLHHKLIGVDEFIVYNSQAISNQLKEELFKRAIKLNIFPYNFPYTQSETENRIILETDCLLRTTDSVKYVALARPHEYLMPKSNFQSLNTIIKNINQNSNEIKRFEIYSRNICVEQHNQKILTISNRENADTASENVKKFLIYKPDIQLESAGTIDIDKNTLAMHRFMRCANKTKLLDWRLLANRETVQYLHDINYNVVKYF